MPESKKVVIKVDFHDDNDKRKALKAVFSLLGIHSLAIDKDKILTISGHIDPVDVVEKLKNWHTDILTVGPAKEQIPQKPKDGGKKNGNDPKGGFVCCYPVEDDPWGCVIL